MEFPNHYAGFVYEAFSNKPTIIDFEMNQIIKYDFGSLKEIFTTSLCPKHISTSPVVAVHSSDGFEILHFHSQNTSNPIRYHQDDSSFSSKVTILNWSSNFVVLGYNSGRVSVCALVKQGPSEMDRCPFEIHSLFSFDDIHKHEISSLASSDVLVMVGSIDGSISFWEILLNKDGSMAPELLFQDNCKSPILSCLLLKNSSIIAKSFARSNTCDLIQNSFPLYCSKDGKIYTCCAKTNSSKVLVDLCCTVQDFIFSNNPTKPKIFATVFGSNGVIVCVFSLETMSIANRVKFDGLNTESHLKILSSQLFASLTTGEGTIRIWDMENDEMECLGSSNDFPGEILEFEYNDLLKLLAVVTSSGILVIWRRELTSADSFSWILFDSIKFCENRIIKPTSIEWNHNDLLVGTDKCVTILKLKECVTLSTLNSCAIRCEDSQFLIHNFEESKTITTSRVLGKNITDVTMSLDVLAIKSDDNEITIYDMDYSANRLLLRTNFCFQSRSLHMHEKTLIFIHNNRIIFTCLQGAKKLEICFTKTEGKPIALDLLGDYLLVATDKKIFKLMALVCGEYKYIGNPISFEGGNSSGVCKLVRLNSDISMFSFILQAKINPFERISNSGIFVGDFKDGNIRQYNFLNENVSMHVKYVINNHMWDVKEPSLLGCDVTYFFENMEVKKKITTLFVIRNEKIREQTCVDLAEDFHLRSLARVSIPFLYITSSSALSHEISFDKRVSKKLINDFVPFHEEDDETRETLTKFSQLKTNGQIDDAIDAIKSIRNTSIWENLAVNCVKARRIDIAQICLAKMGYARGALAIKASIENGEMNEAIATLAVQLGLLDDASMLYKECGRYDLLVHLYVAQGKWTDALEIAQKKDRLRLKTTQYQYAEYLKSNGDIDAAIKFYELAEVAEKEVPRMLHKLKKIEKLEDYAEASQRGDILKWVASYHESTGELEKAMMFYEKAKDTLSLVRILCSLQDYERAANLIQSTSCRVSSHYLARHLEEIGEICDSIEYFKLCGSFNHAVRLSIAYGLDSDLMSLALQSNSPQVINNAAYYFKESKDIDKALTLFDKCGKLKIALDLFFDCEEKTNIEDYVFDLIETSMKKLSPKARSHYMSKYVDKLINIHKFEKAAVLLASELSLFEKALDICVTNNVDFTTEEMITNLTPSQQESTDKQYLIMFAKALKGKGKYVEASNIYFAAEAKMKGLKCLVQSGFTSYVIQYAVKCHDNKIYELSANYLQHQ